MRQLAGPPVELRRAWSDGDKDGSRWKQHTVAIKSVAIRDACRWQPCGQAPKPSSRAVGRWTPSSRTTHDWHANHPSYAGNREGRAGCMQNGMGISPHHPVCSMHFCVFAAQAADKPARAATLSIPVQSVRRGASQAREERVADGAAAYSTMTLGVTVPMAWIAHGAVHRANSSHAHCRSGNWGSSCNKRLVSARRPRLGRTPGCQRACRAQRCLALAAVYPRARPRPTRRSQAALPGPS